MTTATTQGRFEGRTVVVTGGGGGIGTALCGRFAGEGGRVAVLDRAPAAAEATAGAITGRRWVRASGRAATSPTGPGRRSGSARIDGRTRPRRRARSTTPVGTCSNRSPKPRRKTGTRSSPSTCVGALHLHQAVLPAGWSSASGAASSTSRRTPPGSARPVRPCTRRARAASSSFSKTLAREHARHGITVNVVCPGPTDTALLASVTEAAANPEKLVEAFRRSIPLGRIGQPDDLAGAVAVPRQRRRRPSSPARCSVGLRRPDHGRLSSARPSVGRGRPRFDPHPARY